MKTKDTEKIKMEKFKEKRIVKILDATSVIIGLCFFLSLVIGIFYHPFLIGFLLLPLAIVPIALSWSISDKDKYTKEFIKYIESKIKDAHTIEQLNDIDDEFTKLAIDGNFYCLSFQATLKEIQRDLFSKIELLHLIETINRLKK